MLVLVRGTHAPLDSLSDFERGKALTAVAQAARDPYTKKRLVAKAANLILGEEFIPVPDSHPVAQFTLFNQGFRQHAANSFCK